MSAQPVIEVDCCQQAKSGQNISGDVFLSRKLPKAGRVVSIMADGLGSGVEAATLASLTSSMAMEYVVSDLDLRRSAEIVMDVLPIDRERHISYTTFTIVDTGPGGEAEVVSHAGPHFLQLREGRKVELVPQRLHRERWSDRELLYWHFPVRLGDRIVVLSDGVTQAGLGSAAHPLGWGEEGAERYLVEQLAAEPGLSARLLSRRVVREAISRDDQRAGDDVSCGVIYFRQPRRLMVLSGPPYAESRDREYAERLRDFDGTRVVCGGTTANIVSRELGLEVTMDLRSADNEVPAISVMPGIDLVTEGMLTLGKVAELLESRAPSTRQNGATRLADLLLDHDSIEFVVGTRVNEAHQDPSLPVHLDIRRNVIRRIARALDDTYLKQVSVEFI